jgi:hypothetical protein
MNGRTIIKRKPTSELHLDDASIFDDGSQDFHFMDRPETNKGKKVQKVFTIRPKKGETWYSRKQGYSLPTI